MRYFIFIVFLSFTSSGIFAQQLTCVVRDATSGAALPGATVSNVITGKHSSTDTDGRFGFQADGQVDLEISFVGYVPGKVSLEIRHDTVIDVALSPLPTSIDEVSIVKKNDMQHVGTQTGMKTLQAAEINKLPGTMGETDVLKTVGKGTGVKQTEGQQGFVVRGGSYDQNLVLLDDATIYNASHLLGFYSVFNTWAVGSAAFYKSGMPARFGGRSASVMQVEGRCGSLDKWENHLSVGLLSSNLSLSGPLVKNKLSVAMSGRRSYIDMIILPAVNKITKDKLSKYENRLMFQDYNVKLLYKLSAKDRIELSAYTGSDMFTIYNKTNYLSNEVSWGNTTASLRWRHVYSPKLSASSSLSMSSYGFCYNLEQDMYSMVLKTGIQTTRLRHDYLLIQDAGNLRLGIDCQLHTYTPSIIDARVKDYSIDLGQSSRLSAVENALYAEYPVQLGSHISLTTGLRLSQFAHLGPFTHYGEGLVQKDSTVFKRGQVVKNFFYPEPRITASYRTSEHSSVKASATFNTQFSHIVPIISSALPAEMWLPSTTDLVPQKVLQASCGYFVGLWGHEFGIDLYGKVLKDLWEPRGNMMNFYDRGNIKELLARGEGRAFGCELSIDKRSGKLSYSLAYTYSRSLRLFADINGGRVYVDKYDKPHEFNASASYDIGRRWSLQCLFSYASGVNITMPKSRYIVQSSIINEYGQRNGFRMPAYHRADLSVKYSYIKREKFKADVIGSVVNLYNRLNPYYMYDEVTGDIKEYKLQVTTHEVWLFPVLPSISLQFSF